METNIREILLHIHKEVQGLCDLISSESNDAYTYLLRDAKDHKRNLALKYAWTFLGKWYKWGGDDPSGFDCSGLICEVLQSVGIIDRKKDLNAQMFWDMLTTTGRQVDGPYAGCLVFWHSSKDLNKVIHIELCIDKEHSIGASGGGSDTINIEVAKKRNAFIKIRPFRSRSLIKGFADPFKPY